MSLGRDGDEAAPAWMAQLAETHARWHAFVQKLEERMDEFGAAAVPELRAEFERDEDIHRRAPGRMQAGIKGQLDQMLEKARAVYEEKVGDFHDAHRWHVDVLDPRHDLLRQFRDSCRERLDALEHKRNEWRTRVDATAGEDLEAVYRDILDEYAAIADRFLCQQCGAPLRIEKPFFITAYVACPACRTQNTFSPSTQARRLERIGRALAEQRCHALLHQSGQASENERAIYFQIHQLRLFGAGLGNAAVAREQAERIAVLERQRGQAIANSQRLYLQYLRAMVDEWNAIVPGFEEQNERIHQRMVEEFERRR